MSNMNNVDEQEITAFAKDYAELCKKHGLYLVFNDDVWLQYAGNEQDLAEVEPNLVEILGEDRKIEPADQWTHEEQTKFTEENQPVIVFNRIGAFVNFAKGMEIKQNNGTISDNDRKLLEQLDMAVIKGTSTAVNMSAIPFVMTDEQIAALTDIKDQEITMPNVNVPVSEKISFYDGVPYSETQDEYIDKIMLDVMQAEGTLYSEQGTDFARTVAKRAIAEECERCAKVCENLGMNAGNERMCAYAIRNTGMV